MPQRIPLVVIGGFLGAGKTTLLNHLLTRSGDRKIAALVNDFGPINVDAALVAAHDGETLSLTNGCVCCSIGSGLEDALTRVLARTPPMDLVVIEASGVSDPGRIAQIGLSDPMLQLQAVIILADAEQVVSQLDDPLLGDTLQRQIDAASLLVLNKIDLVSEAQRQAVRARIQDQFGTMAIIETQDAAVPIAALTADIGPLRIPPLSERAPAQGGGHDDHGDRGGSQTPEGHNQDHPHHSHDEPDHPFAGGTWHGTGVVNADLLIAALKGLPRTIVRAKGWVTTDRHGTAIVQLAGGRVRIERATPPGTHTSDNEIVFLGIRNTGAQAAVDAALDPLIGSQAGGHRS